MMFYLSGLRFAAAIGLAFFSTRKIVVEVPKEDRQYMDPPPTFYRVTWPLVRLTAHYFGWALTEATATRIQESLKRAGQDYTLTPQHFFSGKIVASLLFGVGAGYVSSKMGQAFIGGFLVGATLGFFLPELWLSDMTK